MTRWHVYFYKYLAICNAKSLPKSIRNVPKYVQLLSKYLKTLKKLQNTFELWQSGKNLLNLVTLVAASFHGADEWMGPIKVIKQIGEINQAEYQLDQNIFYCMLRREICSK